MYVVIRRQDGSYAAISELSSRESTSGLGCDVVSTHATFAEAENRARALQRSPVTPQGVGSLGYLKGLSFDEGDDRMQMAPTTGFQAWLSGRYSWLFGLIAMVAFFAALFPLVCADLDLGPARRLLELKENRDWSENRTERETLERTVPWLATWAVEITTMPNKARGNGLWLGILGGSSRHRDARTRLNSAFFC